MIVDQTFCSTHSLTNDEIGTCSVCMRFSKTRTRINEMVARSTVELEYLKNNLEKVLDESLETAKEFQMEFSEDSDNVMI